MRCEYTIIALPGMILIGLWKRGPGIRGHILIGLIYALYA